MPQTIYSRTLGNIEVERMWDDDVQVVKIRRNMVVIGARPQEFLYWRLHPYPEREATREDLIKAISSKPLLNEALICLENQDVMDIDKVLAARRKIMESAGVEL